MALCDLISVIEDVKFQRENTGAALLQGSFTRNVTLTLIGTLQLYGYVTSEKPKAVTTQQVDSNLDG